MDEGQGRGCGLARAPAGRGQLLAGAQIEVVHHFLGQIDSFSREVGGKVAAFLLFSPLSFSRAAVISVPVNL